MATTESLLLKIAENLRRLRYSSATGGSTTTLIDTTMDEPDQYLNGGTIFCISGNNAGKSCKVTTWTTSGTTFTVPTQSAAFAAGNAYAVCDNKYPREALVAALNRALSELGPFDAKDESLTTV